MDENSSQARIQQTIDLKVAVGWHVSPSTEKLPVFGLRTVALLGVEVFDSSVQILDLERQKKEAAAALEAAKKAAQSRNS